MRSAADQCRVCVIYTRAHTRTHARARTHTHTHTRCAVLPRERAAGGSEDVRHAPHSARAVGAPSRVRVAALETLRVMSHVFLYICMPYMYALYVCLICMPCSRRSIGNSPCDASCLVHMHALYVCLICMPYSRGSTGNAPCVALSPFENLRVISMSPPVVP